LREGGERNKRKRYLAERAVLKGTPSRSGKGHEVGRLGVGGEGRGGGRGGTRKEKMGEGVAHGAPCSGGSRTGPGGGRSKLGKGKGEGLDGKKEKNSPGRATKKRTKAQRQGRGRGSRR